MGVDAEVQFLIICFGRLFCCFFFETFVNPHTKVKRQCTYIVVNGKNLLLHKFVIFRSFSDDASLAFFDGLCPQGKKKNHVALGEKIGQQ